MACCFGEILSETFKVELLSNEKEFGLEETSGVLHLRVSGVSLELEESRFIPEITVFSDELERGILIFEMEPPKAGNTFSSLSILETDDPILESLEEIEYALKIEFGAEIEDVVDG